MENISPREVMMQGIAVTLGKDRKDLVPWVDYDPISIDDVLWRQSQKDRNPNGPIWTGD